MALGSLGFAWVHEVGAHDSRIPRQFALGMLGGDLLGSFTPSVSAFAYGYGVADINDFLVKQNTTPNMSVLVEGGYGFVRGSVAPFNQGCYGFANDGDDSVVIPNSDPTNPRDDILVVQVRDQTWGGTAANDVRFHIVQGTPSSSPVDPVLTGIGGTFMPLARIRVGAGVSTITNSNITDLRPLLAVGRVVVGPSTKRSLFTIPAGCEGLRWYETDTDDQLMWTGSDWRYASMGTVKTYTPTWAGTPGAPSIGNGTLVGQYVLDGKRCTLSIYSQFGSTTTGGTGTLTYSLPPGIVGAPIGEQLGSCRIYVPSLGGGAYSFSGFCTVGYSQSILIPHFADNTDSSLYGGWRNSDASAAVGLGIPNVPAGYPIQSTGFIGLTISFLTA